MAGLLFEACPQRLGLLVFIFFSVPAWGGISIQLTIDIVTKQLYRNPGIDLDPLMNKPAETVAREKHPNTMKAREEPGSKGNPRFWAWDYK